MTNIEKIKQARIELDDVLTTLTVELSALSHEHLVQAIDRLSYLQAEAIRQATEVADENFDRAQKLSERIQENVRHIEQQADRSAKEFDEALQPMIDALESLVREHGGRGEGSPDNDPEWVKARIALALAKGEAV